jgi:cell division protein FtsQ
MRKYKWKKILTSTLWVMTGIGAIVLLGAAMQKKSQKLCTDIKIEITGVERHMFIDEKDVQDLLNTTGHVKGTPISTLNLRAMERMVERDPWVSNAEMFLDNNQVLQVRIEERQPVARVFTLDGNSFYVDSGSLRLPLSEKLSARVPSFTGFPSNKIKLARPDSLLLHDIVRVGKYILADSFWMAQTAQVDITPQSSFEMVPVIGDHVVVLGNAEDLDRKFKHLYTFYKSAWLQNGMNTYEKLDVQYSNQVVAVRKGTGKALVDSARAHELMQGFLAQSQINMGDSSGANIPSVKHEIKPHVDSVARKRSTITAVTPLLKATTKTKSVAASNNKPGKKSLTNGKKSGAKKDVKKKPAATERKPKAVLNKNK